MTKKKMYTCHANQSRLKYPRFDIFIGVEVNYSNLVVRWERYLIRNGTHRTKNYASKGTAAGSVTFTKAFLTEEVM